MSATIDSVRNAGTRRDRRSLFFPVMATLIALIVFGGFFRSFYLRRLLGAQGSAGAEPLPLPLVVIVHGIVYTTWIVIFLVQSWLIQGRRVSTHRALGYFGLVVAAGVVVLGLATATNFVPRNAAAGTSLPGLTANLFANVVNMALFAFFVSLAVYWRRKPLNHKRMMYFSAVFVLGPALSSQRPIGEFLERFIPQPSTVVIVLLIAAVLWHDIATTRRILPVSLIGVASYAAWWIVYLTLGDAKVFQNWTATLL